MGVEESEGNLEAEGTFLASASDENTWAMPTTSEHLQWEVIESHLTQQSLTTPLTPNLSSRLGSCL
jgi:hypothetical protein